MKTRCEEMIVELKSILLNGEFTFMDRIVELVEHNKLFLSDNYEKISKNNY